MDAYRFSIAVLQHDVISLRGFPSVSLDGTEGFGFVLLLTTHSAISSLICPLSSHFFSHCEMTLT